MHTDSGSKSAFHVLETVNYVLPDRDSFVLKGGSRREEVPTDMRSDLEL
jgi:hypothetical protein